MPNKLQHGADAIIDVSEYRMSRFRESSKAHYDSQAALCDAVNGKAIYCTYYDPAFAICEVAYSRLCKFLGLKCVTAQYSVVNFGTADVLGGLSRIPTFVSVSEYDPQWIPIGEWESDHLSNVHEVFEHAVIGLLMTQSWWEEKSGYVLPDCSYIKANNGHALYGLGLRVSLAYPDTPLRYSPFDRSDFLENSAELERGYPVFNRLAAITDSQIEECLQMPTCEYIVTAQAHLKHVLEWARDAAYAVIKRPMQNSPP